MITNWMDEEWALVATIDPVDLNGSSATSDAIDMSLYHQIGVWIAAGVLAASSTNTFSVTESATSGGTYTTITGKTQATVNTDDALQWFIGVKSEELAAGMRYIKILNAGSAHSQFFCVLVFGQPRFKPGTDNDLASVTTSTH